MVYDVPNMQRLAGFPCLQGEEMARKVFGDDIVPAQLSLEGLLTQRWNAGREKRIPRNGKIDPSQFHVEPFESTTVPEAFIKRHHYSGSFPACVKAFGLWQKTGPTAPSELVGVTVFGPGSNNRTIPKWTGQDFSRGVILSRLTMLDDVPGNAETFFLSRAVEQLQQVKRTAPDERGRTRPLHRAIVSFSDPVKRIRANGEVVMPGHFGGIYQALSMEFGGRSTGRKVWMNPAGELLNERSLSKVRNEERGFEGVMRYLEQCGADPRRPGEVPRAWLDRVLKQKDGPFIQDYHPGNYVYVWALDREAKKIATATLGEHLPYPKPDLTGRRHTIVAPAPAALRGLELDLAEMEPDEATAPAPAF